MPQEKFIAAASLQELRDKEMLVVTGADRPVALIYHQDQVYAVDNRCPHLGFPLHKGTVKDGILTCHWHHARFDLCGGCTFDLFADDVPSFKTKVEGDQVFISDRPSRMPSRDYYYQRLQRGLEQNISLVQAKSLIGLLDMDEALPDILRALTLYHSRNFDGFTDGMVSLTVAANLWPHLGQETRVHALCYAARGIAANSAGQPARRERTALEGYSGSADQLERWLRHWLMVRERDGAERTLLTGARSLGPSPRFNDLCFGGVSDRIFSDNGHTLDFLNKAFKLLGHIGWEHAEAVLPGLVPALVFVRGAQESAAWRNPVDLIALIENAESALPKLLEIAPETAAAIDPEATAILLGEDPARIVRLICHELKRGVGPLEIGKHICYAAALHLARFPKSNDIVDWFDPVHTFIYTNAVYQSLTRSISQQTVRGLLHGALAVYQDRFLNIPAARLPEERPGLDSLPAEAEAIFARILDTLDNRSDLNAVPALVTRYFQQGHDESALIDTLAFATLREDLDFHKIQALEAAVQQAQLWDRPRAAHFYVAAARHLAAHCPTPRAAAFINTVAMRLHRGENIYEEEAAQTPSS